MDNQTQRWTANAPQCSSDKVAPLLMRTFLCLISIIFAAVMTAPLSAKATTHAPRMLILGDSNIFESFGRELEADFTAAGFFVKRRGKPTSGMARPDFFDWLSDGAELVDKHRPEVVLIMFGGNDGQRLEPYPGSGDKRIKWKHAEEWIVEYTRRVRTLARVLGAHGARVFVLSPTNRRSTKAVERMQRVIECQRRAVSGLYFATWVDTWTPSSGEDGRYLRRGSDPLARHHHWREVRYRKGDGIHLTKAGAIDLRQKVTPVLRRDGVIAW